jgi:hypothetical protein
MFDDACEKKDCRVQGKLQDGVLRRTACSALTTSKSVFSGVVMIFT